MVFDGNDSVVVNDLKTDDLWVATRIADVIADRETGAQGQGPKEGREQGPDWGEGEMCTINLYRQSIVVQYWTQFCSTVFNIELTVKTKNLLHRIKGEH